MFVIFYENFQKMKNYSIDIMCYSCYNQLGILQGENRI